LKQKLAVLFIIFSMILSMAGCGAAEETTLSGMVYSVDGTVISLMEMDSSNMGSMDFAEGQMPQMPEGMTGFQGFGDFDPEDFQGMVPEGGSFSQWGEGTMPQMPEGMTPPEGMPSAGDGEMPDFGSFGSGFGNFAADAETKEVDISGAHISVEIDGGKASGSMEDIKAGTFVTITMNKKGEVTNVLVTQQSFFGGNGRMPAN